MIFQRMAIGGAAVLLAGFVACTTVPIEADGAPTPRARGSAVSRFEPNPHTMALAIMTFNIRYGTAEDGENSWQNRRDLLVETIRRCEPDVLGTQEGLDFQLDYIQDHLGGDYRWFGVGRDADGTGEHAAIFYRRDRVAPLESGTFWVSKTPEVPGTKSWNSHHNRVTTWARFHHYTTGRQFVCFNTHLDNGSPEARQQGARLLARRINAIPEEYPVIVTGDFNATAGKSEPWQTLIKAGLKDAWQIAGECKGPAFTFNGFKPPSEAADNRIDWILVPEHAAVQSCETVVYSRDGRYPSDHCPVVAHLTLP